MMTLKQIDEFSKKLDDPSFDFEGVMYKILAKLKKNDLIGNMKKFQTSIIRYVTNEWEDEKIPPEELANLIVIRTEKDPRYQKIEEVLTDEENFFLQTSILGSMVSMAN